MTKLNLELETVSVTRLTLALLLAFLLTFLLLSPEQNPKSSNKVLRKVQVFFQSTELDKGGYDCTEVFPVTRWVDSSAYPPMAALRELLKGPTKEEKAEGYITNINSGVGIKGLWVEDGLARVDLTGKLAKGGGSC